MMLIAVSITCEDEVKQAVGAADSTASVNEAMNEGPPDVATCDPGKDSTCKDFENKYSQSEGDNINGAVSTENEDIKSTETQSDIKNDQESHLKQDAYSGSDTIVKADNSIVSETLQEGEDVKPDETDKSEVDSEESTEKSSVEADVVSGNSTSNSSAVVQWFRYIVEQFLEEFKDGIYSKPNETEPVNTTETNLSVPLVNETIEQETEKNTTETVETTTLNTTDTSNTTDTKKVKFHCTGRNVTDNSNATVKLITSARLLQLLAFDKNETENMTDCLLVMFYAPWCQFCAKTAPHYNAVARAFPQLDFVAVDTAQFSNLLARFGTVSVPNILVFHQSRAAVKFNQTERIFENFVSFIQNATGLEPNTTVNVTEADYLGPIPSAPTDEPDYLLLISWIFVLCCSSFMFVKSQRGQQWITRVRILWQEHQHID